MKLISTPRLCISSSINARDSIEIALGLTHSLRKAGFKVGICFQRTEFAVMAVFKRLTGIPVACLDPALMEQQQMMELLYLAGLGVDIVLIVSSENVLDPCQHHSSRPLDIAAFTRTPVILAHSCPFPGETQSAIISSLIEAVSGCSMRGFIFTGYGKEAKRFPSFIETLRFSYPHIPVWGGVPVVEAPGLSFDGRQHGAAPLIQRRSFDDLARPFTEQGLLDELLTVARQAPCIEIEAPLLKLKRQALKIAVADDICFAFSYQDNFKLLQYYGIEIIPFSPLTDIRLPREAKIVWLQGGHIDAYAYELAQNQQMHEALSRFYNSGGKIIAESAATAFLSAEFSVLSSKQVFKGAGIIRGKATAKKGRTIPDKFKIHLSSLSIDKNISIGAAACSDWNFDRSDEGVQTVNGISSGTELSLLEKNQLLAIRGFLHFGSSPDCLPQLFSFLNTTANNMKK